MNRTFAVVTTFNDDGYIKYGKRMIESFLLHWPKEVELYAYYEGIKPEIINEQLIYIDLLKVCPDLVAFKNRWKDDPVANGETMEIPNGARRPGTVSKGESKKGSFLWNAVKFSHKSYCVIHATQMIKTDVVFWIDADTTTYQDLPINFLEGLLPQDSYCCFLGRHGKYSECGFVGYNIKHEAHIDFMTEWKKYYDNDLVFTLKEWHDCEVFDTIRKNMENENRITSVNLSNPKSVVNHPFVNSILGEYIDHLKGGRKNLGKSKKTDLSVKRNHKYWQ